MKLDLHVIKCGEGRPKLKQVRRHLYQVPSQFFEMLENSKKTIVFVPTVVMTKLEELVERVSIKEWMFEAMLMSSRILKILCKREH